MAFILAMSIHTQPLEFINDHSIQKGTPFLKREDPGVTRHEGLAWVSNLIEFLPRIVELSCPVPIAFLIGCEMIKNVVFLTHHRKTEQLHVNQTPSPSCFEAVPHAKCVGRTAGWTGLNTLFSLTKPPDPPTCEPEENQFQ